MAPSGGARPTHAVNRIGGSPSVEHRTPCCFGANVRGWRRPEPRARRIRKCQTLLFLLWQEGELLMSQPSEHIFYFCCECSPDPKLDSMSLCLLRMTCEKHGPCWHRKM